MTTLYLVMRYLHSRSSTILNTQTRIFRSRRTSAPRGKEEQCEAEGVQNCEVKTMYSNGGAQHMRSGAGGDATPVSSAT